MPHITKEETAQVRKALKTTFPKYKFSVTMDNHSGINVNLMQSDLPFENGDQVNQYWYESHYKGKPEIISFIQKLLDTIDSIKPKKEQHYDSDYGSIPNYYLWIRAGKWNKDYQRIGG